MDDFTCTSMSCTYDGTEACKDCSHAPWHGQGEDAEGYTHYWTFNPRFGPLFTDEHGNGLENQPESEEDVCWKPFDEWQDKRRDASQRHA